jgi:hypothetical protein
MGRSAPFASRACELDIAKIRLDRLEALSDDGACSNAGDARCWPSSARINDLRSGDLRSGDLRSGLLLVSDEAEYRVGVERKLSRVEPPFDRLSES